MAANGFRVQNIVMVEHDSRVKQEDFEINTAIIDSLGTLCVDVMNEKLGFRIFVNIEGLQLKEQAK